jgi:FkbM family methyltransferase
VWHISGTVWSQTVLGKEVQFFVADPHDLIQSHHASGTFYEVEELAIIADFFPRGGVFVDIGANVGNHAVYVSRYLYPAQVIVFEPNPAAIPILRINLALNHLERLVDLSHVGVGLSDAPARARAHVPPGNLGATRMQVNDEPDGLPLIRGDDALAGRPVDFIKMDVEGMELGVLRGLTSTIAKWRPRMFIEVENGNVATFKEWLRAAGYVAECTYRRYEANENYMIVPVEASGKCTCTAGPRAKVC